MLEATAKLALVVQEERSGKTSPPSTSKLTMVKSRNPRHSFPTTGDHTRPEPQRPSQEFLTEPFLILLPEKHKGELIAIPHGVH